MRQLKIAGIIALTLLLGFRLNAQVVSFDPVVSTFATGFYTPSNITCDASGNLYVADYNNHKIYKITSAGVVSTLAGSTSGSQDGTGAAAQFKNPGGLVVDASGNIYVVDTGNHRIRKINASGVVTTLAGSTQGFQNATGTATKFYSPTAITIDASGNLYVTDYGNYRIRKVTSAGVVTTFAGSPTQGFNNGTGTNAQFYSLKGISTVDASGSFYVGDGNRLRKITSAAVVSTIAGATDGTSGYANGTGSAVRFYGVDGNMPYDASGNLYISDYSNHRLRKMTSSGVVSSFAGTGKFANTNGKLSEAEFGSPSGAAIDASGNIYVCDFAYGIVKKIGLPTLTTFTTTYGTPSASQSVTLSATELTGDLKVTTPSGYEVSTNSTSGYGPSCSIPNNGTVSSITIYVRLSASAIAGTKNGSLTIASTGASNKTLSLAGTVNKSGQSITFNELTNVSYGVAPITLAATSSSGLGVTYTSSNTAVATIVGNTVTIVGAGTTAITASQSGNTNYLAATSVPRTLVVNKANQTITFATLAAKAYGSVPFNLTATSSSGLGVTYTSSNTAVATIVGNTVTIVGAGTTTITAGQSGNTNYLAATSVPRTLVVNKASQTITFASLSAKTFGDEPFTLLGTSSSGLGLIYTSSNTDVATVVGNIIIIVGAGSVDIIASQAGNGNYNAATSVPLTLVVNKASQTIFVEELKDVPSDTLPFSIIATSSSGLQVSFAVLSGPATINGNEITLLGTEGLVEIEATQSGDNNYKAAEAILASFNVYQITGISSNVAVRTINFYPNPACGTATIDMPSPKETYQLTIYSSTGVTVYETSVRGESKSVDVTSMISGVYYVTLRNTENDLYSGKLMVME